MRANAAARRSPPVVRLRQNRKDQRMANKLDQISHTIGAIETSVCELQRRAEEDREIRDRWHAENRAATAQLSQKLDQHAAAVESMRPVVAGLELSRSKLAAWASIGFASVVVFGWIVEAAIKAAVAWTLSHFQ